jgi:valyl-tRNA synthetase
VVREPYYGALDEYKILEASRLLYGFIWSDFADWYLEILKHEGSRDIAQSIFTEVLKLLHPIMPYITEVLWKELGQEGMLMSASLAQARQLEDEQREAGFKMLQIQDIINTTRSVRTLLGIPPKSIITIWTGESELPRAVTAMTRSNIASAESSSMKRFPLRGGGYICIASEHMTPESIQGAKIRLDETMTTLGQRMEQLDKALGQMADKAPADVVQQKKTMAAQLQAELDETQRSRDALQ